MSSSEALPETSSNRQTVRSPSLERAPNRTKERKRNRKCISCLRCHRLKVRCDRKSPCTRCTTARHPIKCVYENTSDIATKDTRPSKRGKTANTHGPHEQGGKSFEGSLDWNLSLERANESRNSWDAQLIEAEILSTGSNSQSAVPDLDYSPYSEPLDGDILQNLRHHQTASPGYSILSEPTNDMFELHWANYLDGVEQADRILNVSPTESELADIWAGQDYTDTSWLTQASMIPEFDDRSYYPLLDPLISIDCDDG